MQEQELRASIAAVGPLLPVLMWRGVVLDGRKRDAICSELGLVPRVVFVHSAEEACCALWALHPARACALATEELQSRGGQLPSALQISRLVGARSSDVLRVLRGTADKTPPRRSPRRTRSQKTQLIQLWVEPQFKHYVQRAGAAGGLTLSATLRVAAWEYVARHLPRAPNEGTPRAPSPSCVKPRERRSKPER